MFYVGRAKKSRAREKNKQTKEKTMTNTIIIFDHCYYCFSIFVLHNIMLQ